MPLIKQKEAIDLIVSSAPYRIILSNPRKKSTATYNKIDIILKTISGKDCYQAEKYTEKQVFHDNFDIIKLIDMLDNYLEDGYKQINAYSKEREYEMKINKKNECLINQKALSEDSKAKMVPKSNNRKKNYLLDEGTNIPVFVELGIFTKEYKVVNSKYDKYRQINRFTELVEDSLKGYSKEEINIIDFGCGKSYLTFVVYYYLTQIRNIKANIIGLDLKADVINNCNKLAEKFGYTGLKFCVGDINGFKAPFEVDMVITLHACDTATDYALYNAIKWDSDIILSVPCCQHEINKQIRSEELSALTKYGIIKERTSALITDAIRGCMLEYCGYKTDLLEFIDIEHSPKNIMIRAIKGNVGTKKRQDALDEAKRLAEEFSLTQTLMDKLVTDNNGE